MGNENSSPNNTYYSEQQNPYSLNSSYLVESKKYGTFHYASPNEENFDDVSE